MNFKEYITEQKNLHMEHLEDAVLDGGVSGTKIAINYLRAVRDMLAGHTEKKVSLTVKWDGAPAVFAGKDPSDGKFFVAKKGIFNKNPKLYKTNAEIDADTSGDLADKLKACLQHLPKLGITNVIQGDLLFTSNDIKTATIDGEAYITFHPNTIVYAIPTNSVLAKKIKRAKIGVVWHTFYEGETLEGMKAVFGKNILSTLTQSDDVWATDVDYKDVSGKATMTSEETKTITDILSEAGKLFYRIDPKILNGISDNEILLTKIKTFNNTKVRAQQKISDPRRHVEELIDYLNKYYEAETASKKTEKGKQSVKEKSSGVLGFFTVKAKKDLVNIFTVMNLLVDAKNILIKKLDEVKNLHTFLLTKDGYKVTGVEGYVAIDHLTGNAVKLVDRLQFSYANFSPDVIKGWQR